MRMFWAIELPDPSRALLVELQERARRACAGLVPAPRVSWVRPEALHVTFRFLGEVEPDELGRLVGVVEEGVAAWRAGLDVRAAPELRLDALGTFGAGPRA